MNEIEKALKRLKGAFTTVVKATAQTKPGAARLGLGDQTDTIINTSVADSAAVNIYYENSNTESGEIAATDIAILGPGLEYLYHDGIGLEGTLVKLGKPPNSTDEYLYIVGVDRKAEAGQYGPTPLAKQAVQAAGQPSLADVSTLAVQWSGNSDLVLLIGDLNEEYSYTDYNTGAFKTITQISFDCADVVATLASGYHTASLICLDKSDGTAKALSLTADTPPTGYSLPYREAFGATELEALIPGNYPAYMPVALVYSYYGQTAGAALDIYARDVRLWLSSAAAARKLPASTELTESSDAITITQEYHTVKAQTGTTDDLKTVTGGWGRMFLTLQAKSGHTITVKHGTGNIFFNGAADFVLSGDKTLVLFYDGANWADISPETSTAANVSGPTSSIDNDFAMFDGATGKILKDNGLALDTDGTLTANSDSKIPSQKAVKSYVDAVAQGLDPKQSVLVATAAALPTNTYSNGVSGVGATLTGVATGVLTVDGVAIALNDRVLVKDEVAGANNGIYKCTVAGAVGVVYVLTRSIDADTSDELIGAYVFAEAGTSNARKGYICTNTSAITIGTTSITFAQFSSGADTALSNLASVAINTSLLDAADVTDDLGSAAKRWKNGYIQSVIGDTDARPVKNTSGATANVGDVGYVVYDSTDGWVYKTTTTANLAANWCVVLVGAANNSTVYVATRGKVTVNYAGTAPSAAHYLVTSTTGGSAGRSTTMHPAIFAVCLAAGSGGTVLAQLLCGSNTVGTDNGNDIYRAYQSSTTGWTGTINGAPSATSVVVTTSTGNINTIKPYASTQLFKARLYNLTRGTSRLISSVSGTTVTTVSSTDSWASGDSLTIASQTITGGPTFIDLDGSQQSAIPVNTRYLIMGIFGSDTGSQATIEAHPFEAYVASKVVQIQTQVAGIYFFSTTPPVALKQNLLGFCIASASGTGTGDGALRLNGYVEAVP